MRALLRRRDVRLLLAGQSLSMFGDWALIIALAIWTKVLTGSNGAAGLVFFVFALAGLVAPLGGLVVDRLPKRGLMVGTHLALAGVVSLLLLVHTRADIWLLYGVTALYGLGGDLFAAARSSMLKAMLPDELLGEANGVLQSVREGLRLFAPLAGAGIYVAAGGAAVALVDAATFLVSAATLVAMPFVEPPAAPREHHFLREVSAGLAHVARTRLLRELTLGTAATMLVVGFSETLIFAVVGNGLHRPPSFVGVLSVCEGIGSVVGGASAGRLLRRCGEARMTGIGVALFALADAFLVVPNVGVVLGAGAFAGLGIVWAVVALTTAYQRHSPLHVQGRVAAAANMLLSVPQTISIAAGAALITVIDYRLEIALMVAVMIPSAVYLVTRRPAEPAGEPALA